MIEHGKVIGWGGKIRPIKKIEKLSAIFQFAFLATKVEVLVKAQVGLIDRVAANGVPAGVAERVGICSADIVHSDLYWICSHQQDDGQGKATQCLIAYRRGHSQAINLAS